MSARLVTTKKGTTLRVKGGISITSSHKFKNLLQDGLEPPGVLVVDMDKAEYLDLSIVQLLCSALTISKNTGVNMFIKDGSGVLGRTLRGAGCDMEIWRDALQPR